MLRKQSNDSKDNFRQYSFDGDFTTDVHAVGAAYRNGKNCALNYWCISRGSFSIYFRRKKIHSTIADASIQQNWMFRFVSVHVHCYMKLPIRLSCIRVCARSPLPSSNWAVCRSVSCCCQLGNELLMFLFDIWWRYVVRLEKNGICHAHVYIESEKKIPANRLGK